MNCLTIDDSTNNPKVDEIKENQSTPKCSCATGANPNCKECCDIFTNYNKRRAFGYQSDTATCECHDICTKDVRDICVKKRTLRRCIPCYPDGSAGCRGGRLPDGPPSIKNVRVLCAEERLNPPNCTGVINEIEFEVVLEYGGNTFVVVTPKDEFICYGYQFARFPSGIYYQKTPQGLINWRNELKVIDGSCKVIEILNVTTETSGNDCILVIEYKVIDKLWKYENLLVSALKPYPENITVCQKFEQGHEIEPCEDTGSC